jgi:hypothetical protein
MFIQSTKANIIGEFLPLFAILSETETSDDLAERLRGVLNTVAEKVNIALSALVEDGFGF